TPRLAASVNIVSPGAASTAAYNRSARALISSADRFGAFLPRAVGGRACAPRLLDRGRPAFVRVAARASRSCASYAASCCWISASIEASRDEMSSVVMPLESHRGEHAATGGVNGYGHVALPVMPTSALGHFVHADGEQIAVVGIDDGCAHL